MGGHGLLCVGGRPKNSHLQKHPMILKGKSHLTQIIMEYYHHQHQHAGLSLLIGIVSAKYYFTGARKVIRKLIRDFTRACVTCKHHYAKTLQQQMGQLPEVRNTYSSICHNWCGLCWDFGVDMVRGKGQAICKFNIVISE